MSQRTLKKKPFSICMVLVCFFVFVIVILSGCGTMKDKPAKERPVNEKTVSKKPLKVGDIPYKKKLKPVPVFKVQAVITVSDGTVYEVDNFAFYSTHRSFGGGFYTPSSGNKKWPFYLNRGPLWKKIDFSRVKSLNLRPEKGNYRRMIIDVNYLDGSVDNGSFPTHAYNLLWTNHGDVHLAGKSKVLNRVGEFKCEIDEVLKFERVEGLPPETPPLFLVTYDKKENNQVTLSEPCLRLIWKRKTPKYLDKFQLKSQMSVTVNNTAIKIKPEEIESVIVPSKSNMAFTVKMKQGDMVKIKNFPPRIYGILKNGDVIFTDFFKLGRPVIKEVRIN